MLNQALTLTLLFLYSCQTPLFEKEPAVLPELYKEKFNQCSNMSGFGYIDVKYKKKPMFSSQIEWIINTPEIYKLFLLNPLGQESLVVEVEDNNIAWQSSQTELSPELSIDREGFLISRGHWLGLRVDEIPCLINATLPREWSLSTAKYFVDDKKQKLALYEKKRTILISFMKDNNQNIKEICIDFKWNIFWILKKANIKSCFKYNKNKEILLNINDKIELIIKHFFHEE